MIHAFILIILVNGEIVSDREPMLFFDVNRCNVFASAIVSGKREARVINHDAVKLAAYCLPILVDPEKVRIYT
jgi:hypothetical protein